MHAQNAQVAVPARAHRHFYAQRIIAQKHTIRMDKILNSYYVNDKVCGCGCDTHRTYAFYMLYMSITYNSTQSKSICDMIKFV